MRESSVMNQDWQQFWEHFRTRTKLIVWSLPLSLIPYFFNFPKYWEHGGWWLGLFTSLGFGLLVGGTVWGVFIVVYAVLMGVQKRSGYFPRTTWWFDLAVALCGTVLGILLMMWAQKLLWNVPLTGMGFMLSMVIGLICLTVFMLYSMYQEARAESLQQQAALADARYHTLETQMRPHFLFNALNSLAELIESKQENAAEVALTLSDLYRQILTNSKTKTASLESELEITRAYLELEQLRFGQRLQFTIVTPDDVANIFLPSLSLQTLVENAVKHGIAKAVAGGSIEIRVEQHAPQWFQLRVTNSGAPFTANGNGTGLANTRERLQLLYGARHQFHLGTDGAGRTCASFNFTGENV